MTAVDLTHGLDEQADAPIFEARDLVVDYHSRGQVNRALNHVSLSIAEGEAVGLIGESGSGKTTLARTLLGLIRPVHGQVTFRGQDLYAMKSIPRYRMLGRDASLVFQDPRSSLNPRLTVGAVVRDPLTVQRIGTRAERTDRVAALLESVGLPAQLVSRPVRALSGGQLQRVALARALAVEPGIIVADEPTSALDVSVQAQILNLIQQVRASRRLALLVVSHDIRVIRYLTDRTAVMYNGEIVELGSTARIHDDPQHEYTRTLLASVPSLKR
ncbi:ABC transporter ATP-binding protein [Jiangella ureilytica]|uniref:ABC transporter ATP-binding protein n=1 Tax=Jiangella ureilytica TaxID=2530374 RepID=A0A4R4RZ20_9ACTN|nr:ABC transporter ATP-binding protein [Jiangella ureilytica]TDC53983.1 ABC transporter ATP-binding protein [Jiangella ureilytica]